MDHRPQNWGRPRDDIYGPYDPSHLSSHFTPTFHSSSSETSYGNPKQATSAPVVTGTSVIALKFSKGVIIAADNLASYGSLARFNDVKRLRSFAGTSVVGFSGDVSDMQYIDRHLNELEIDEAYKTSGVEEREGAGAVKNGQGLNAANLHKYLAKLFYARRNKMDPLWNQVLVAGFYTPSEDSKPATDSDDEDEDDEDEEENLKPKTKPFLAAADLRGTVFSAPCLATGYGAMLALPIMRRFASTEEDAAKLSREQAMKIIKECMKVLYYRDARSWDTYSYAVITKENGVEMVTSEKLEAQSWAFADRIKGYGTQNV